MTNKKINIDEIGAREFYSMADFVKSIARSIKVVTWGAHAWTAMNSKVLRFKVNAHRHTGHIYVSVNASDLFDIYLTTSQGTVKEVFTDIYLEDFVNVIDEKIEFIPEYEY